MCHLHDGGKFSVITEIQHENLKEYLFKCGINGMWLNVESRIVFKTVLLAYKVINGMCSDNLVLNFKSFNGRPSDFLMLETPVAKTKYGKRTFAYNASRLWNALPCDIRTEVSVDNFKKRIKTLLFDGTYDLKKRAYQYQM